MVNSIKEATFYKTRKSKRTFDLVNYKALH